MSFLTLREYCNSGPWNLNKFNILATWKLQKSLGPIIMQTISKFIYIHLTIKQKTKSLAITVSKPGIKIMHTRSYHKFKNDHKN